MKSWEKEEFEKCANCILVATCDSGLVLEDVVFTLQILKAITLESKVSFETEVSQQGPGQ